MRSRGPKGMALHGVFVAMLDAQLGLGVAPELGAVDRWWFRHLERGTVPEGCAVSGIVLVTDRGAFACSSLDGDDRELPVYRAEGAEGGAWEEIKYVFGKPGSSKLVTAALVAITGGPLTYGRSRSQSETRFTQPSIYGLEGGGLPADVTRRSPLGTTDEELRAMAPGWYASAQGWAPSAPV